MKENLDFFVIGVYPVTVHNVFAGFRYKALYPNRTTKWISEDELQAAGDRYEMIPAVRKCIQQNLVLHGAANE